MKTYGKDLFFIIVVSGLLVCCAQAVIDENYYIVRAVEKKTNLKPEDLNFSKVSRSAVLTGITSMAAFATMFNAKGDKKIPAYMKKAALGLSAIGMAYGAYGL